MCILRLVICAALVALCAAVLAVENHDYKTQPILQQSEQLKLIEVIESFNTTTGNHFNIGFLHPGSTVAQSGVVNVVGIAGNFATGRFTYNGSHPITQIVAIDQNVNNTGGYVYQVDGGVFRNNTIIYFQSSVRGGAINFVVNVFVEGAENNLVLGTLTLTSVLLYERALVVSGIPNQIFTSTINVVLDNLRPISFIEVLDRTTNGTGGIATISNGGLGQTQITVSIQSSAAGRGINSHVIVHGATPTSQNDFRLGRFVPGNVVINTQRLFVAAIPNQRVTGNVFFNGNRPLTLIQGLAANANASAGNLFTVAGGINTNGATLVFESITGGFIDVTVSFFGLTWKYIKITTKTRSIPI